MRFGIFNVFSRSPISESIDEGLTGGESPGEALHRGIADSIYAETLGFDDVWVAEGPQAGKVLTGVRGLTLATILAAKTSRIRIGTGITVMPLQHPLEVATEATSVDLLSNGRFDLGIGRGISARTGSGGYNVLGSGKYPATPPDIRAQYVEAISCVKGLLHEERFTFKGDYYEFNDCKVFPEPTQRPLPIWVVAQSPQTFVEMGKLGANLLIPIPGYHGGIQTWEDTRERLLAYRQAWKDAGHPEAPKVIVRAPMFLADTKDQAMEVARRTVTMFRYRFRQLVREQGHGGAYSDDPRASGAFFGVGAQEITGSEFPVDEAVEHATITGTYEYAISQVERIQQDLEAYEVLVEPEITASSLREDRIRTMRIVADKVMPRFK